jgi:Surface adhesin CshA repetitive domain
VTIAGQGAYTLDPATGGITFSPEARFAGTPSPVTYRVIDAYGQTATATYTPAVAALDGSAPDTLPVTGPDAPTLISVGLSMVLLGTALVSRRWESRPGRWRDTGTDLAVRVRTA